MKEIQIDEETHVVVPRKLPRAAHQKARDAMPAEYDYWQEDGRLQVSLRPIQDCVDPQSVWDAAISEIEKTK